MKVKILSTIILVITVMSILPVFLNESYAIEDKEKYVFVGDERTLQMMGRAYPGCNYPQKGEAVGKFNGMTRASYAFKDAKYNFFYPKNEKYIKTELNNFSNGTVVISWLGFLDLATSNSQPEKIANDYAKKYVEIAKEYSNLEFVVISVTPVKGYKAKNGVTNESIMKYNNIVSGIINYYKLNNLKFIDIYDSVAEILKKDNSIEQDAYNYNNNIYKQISDLIYSKVNKEEDNKEEEKSSLEKINVNFKEMSLTLKNYFYKEDFFKKYSDTELELGNNHLNNTILLNDKVVAIKFDTSKEFKYKYNDKYTFYEAYYIDEDQKEIKGYIEVETYNEIVKYQKEQEQKEQEQKENTVNVVKASIDFSKNNRVFYPASYLKVTSSNKLERTKAKGSKTIKLASKLNIKCYIDFKFKYGNGTVYLAEYNGEIGYINVKALSGQKVVKSKEKIKNIKTDFSKLGGTYNFYSPMYLRIKSGAELMGVTSHKNEKVLLKNEQSMTVFTNQVYQKGNIKFYRAIFNGNIGYVNVNVVTKVNALEAKQEEEKKEEAKKEEKKEETKQEEKKEETKNENTKSLKIDFSKATATHYFYPDTYLTVKSGTKRLTHVANSKDNKVLLKETKEVKFYTDTKYILKTTKGQYNLYKVEMDGKTGFINANFLTNTKLHVK